MMVTSKTLFANFDYWSVVAGFSILSKRTKWAKTNKNTDFEIGHSPHIPNNRTELSKVTGYLWETHQNCKIQERL